MVQSSAFDWGPVLPNAIAAAQKVLGQKWQVVSMGAKNQIENLTNTAKYISENKNNMTEGEYEAIIANQALALQNVLLIYEDIGIATAEQTVQAVWAVVGGALQSAADIAIKI